jgi:hypothetical protein
MKGMSKIPFLGDLPGMKDVLSEVEDEVKAIEKAEGRIVSKQEAMNMAFKKMGSVIKDSLNDPLIITALTTKLLVSGFKALFEIGMKADAEIVSLSKSMAISTDQATEMRNRFKEIQDSGGSIYETTTNLVGAQLELAAAFGATAGFTNEQLKDQILLTKQMGFSVEEAQGLQQLAAANGMSAKDVTNSVIKQTSALAKQTGIQLDNKKVIGEVAKVSGQLRLQYQNNPALIAQAVVQTQKLGISLETAAKSSKSLLDFESSISNELSAELLTGKDLNLEKARLLALNGNIAEASAEILKQVGGTAEFSKMNRIQQEAIAAATGLSREELAASLVEREALDKLGVKDAATAKAKFDLLVKEKGYAAAVAEMGDDQYANQLKQQSIQERMNQSVEKMKELFISVAEPILKIVSPLVDLVTTVLPAINFLIYPITSAFQVLSGLINGSFEGLTKTQVVLGGIVTTLGIAYGVYKGIKAAAAFITLLKEKELITEGRIMLLKMRTFLVDKAAAAANVIKGAWNTFGGIPFVGAALAAAAAVAGIGYIASQTKFAKGGIVTGEINNATIGEAGPEAIIPLNSPTANRILGGNNSSPQQDLSPLLEEMRALRQEQSRSNNKPVIVENSMNGTKFGTSVAMNTYKIQ